MSQDSTFTFAILGAMAVLMAALIVYAVRAQKRRARDLENLAMALGLKFTADPGDAVISTFGAHHLLALGYRRHLDNLMQGMIDGIETTVFDLRYSSGGARNRTSTWQTVVVVTKPARALPGFSLRPENIMHRLGSLLGYQDIDFKDYPEFSRRFLLRGQDEAGIRSRFTPAVINFFERHLSMCAEGSDSHLLYYRHRRLAAAKAVRGLIAEAHELSRTLG